MRYGDQFLYQLNCICNGLASSINLMFAQTQPQLDQTNTGICIRKVNFKQKYYESHFHKQLFPNNHQIPGFGHLCRILEVERD